jgi:ABC-type Fe3+/spermidine/putrescine transport system ATPase subunit
MPIAVCEQPDDGRFVLSIRPEAIVVGEESRSLANHYEGTIGDVLFLGHEREVLADVGDQRVMVRSGQNSVAPGDPIEFGWDPQSAVIVKETGSWRQLQQDV